MSIKNHDSRSIAQQTEVSGRCDVRCTQPDTPCNIIRMRHKNMSNTINYITFELFSVVC